MSKYRHIDYWLSLIAMTVTVNAITFEIMYAWKHGADCFTGREVIAALGIFSATFLSALAATGWNVSVNEKYRECAK